MCVFHIPSQYYPRTSTIHQEMSFSSWTTKLSRPLLVITLKDEAGHRASPADRTHITIITAIGAEVDEDTLEELRCFEIDMIHEMNPTLVRLQHMVQTGRLPDSHFYGDITPKNLHKHVMHTLLSSGGYPRLTQEDVVTMDWVPFDILGLCHCRPKTVESYSPIQEFSQDLIARVKSQSQPTDLSVALPTLPQPSRTLSDRLVLFTGKGMKTEHSLRHDT